MNASQAAAAITLVLLCVGAGAGEPSAPTPRVDSRYTFSWPVGSGAPAPRGGTTRGAEVKPEAGPSAQWQALRAAGISDLERDRRAILAMAGGFRVNFDFLEVADFTGDGSRARPYQSWGTEQVFVERDEPRRISLVHVLEMHVLGADGTPVPPMVTKHWRQDWVFEPTHLIEYQGGNRWSRRALAPAERQGRWSQVVYQVDESPRYGSLGRWEHTPAFSTWISGDTARPLPRREWSVRKDYELLRGTNRHTVLPTGWLHEENNLKETRDSALPYVGREYGVARYERITADYFIAAGKYYEATRAYWREVLAVWDKKWQAEDTIALTANSDQSGAYAELFEQADQFAAGRLPLAAARERIDASLEKQRARAPAGSR
jgi:hypothetical protein